MKTRAARLWIDIHRIARTYHWSERDILALELSRREKYMTLLEAESDAELYGELARGGR